MLGPTSNAFLLTMCSLTTRPPRFNYLLQLTACNFLTKVVNQSAHALLDSQPMTERLAFILKLSKLVG